MTLIETPHLPLLLLYLCFSPRVSDYRFHASKQGANMKPLKKFNFSSSSTLIEIIMCLSCKRVVEAAVYQRSFNLIHLFCNAGIPDLFRSFCTPPFFVSEVNKAVFACVCLEKGTLKVLIFRAY